MLSLRAQGSAFWLVLRAQFSAIHLPGSSRVATNASKAGVPKILSLFDGDRPRAPQRLRIFERADGCGLDRIRGPGTSTNANLAINSRMKQNLLDISGSECFRVAAAAA
ncbi:MAG: hypothetical protein ACK4IS_02365 [Erythrobacter sp.]